ncbi:MAG: erythromycin biosynthesis sensory transduction protein eryC1 [Desulfobacca sp. RBG_16_60_12]|nr:MAG: erythromycin biosynthesis sensory transduction protein eryC1 [Desulfobacca sp. RBG_16_60_12]
MLEAFERAFAEFCSTRYCVGVSSGTDALRFALMAAGIGNGDTVVTVPNTFIATTEAITQAGAQPEFVDIDERTYTMDVDKLREYLETMCWPDSTTRSVISHRTGKRLAAIIPVHLYGQMADMDTILGLAERYNLVVIEDACQAHGAEYFSKRQTRSYTAGSMGRAAAFSFYPGKNLGACGEAGAVTTNDEELARTIRMLRDHGQAKKYYHEIEGYNGKLDAIQAGILQIKLGHLAEWNEKRRTCAQRYQEMLGSAEGIILPYEGSSGKAVYHLYVVRVHNRDELQRRLTAAAIGTGIHYPIPLHQQSAYRTLGYKRGDFPITERLAAEILSLPMFPGLTPAQQSRVVEQVLEFVGLTTAQAA